MEDTATLIARLQRYVQTVAATAPGQPVPNVVPAQPGDTRAVLAGAPPSARRTALLACTLETLRPAARVAGVEVLILSDQSPLDDVLANLDANARGFDPAAPPPTREEAIAFRAELRTNRALTATLDGLPVGAGMFTPPLDGIAELVGIATLAPYRGRGIGAMLAGDLARAAFGCGVDLAILRTDNPAADRVYRRIGFQLVATLIAEDAAARADASDTD